MVPGKSQIHKLLAKYAPNDEYLELIETHGQIVAEVALWCASNTNEPVDLERLEATCLLHDIGSYAFIGAANFSKDFERNYMGHAIFGSEILRREGVDELICAAVETHVLLGLSAQEIKDMDFALPMRDYIPATIEAELLCYADRFHSKHPTFNDFSAFSSRLEKNLPNQALRMKAMSERFGIPDVKALAKKYDHPIR